MDGRCRQGRAVRDDVVTDSNVGTVLVEYVSQNNAPGNVGTVLVEYLSRGRPPGNVGTVLIEYVVGNRVLMMPPIRIGQRTDFMVGGGSRVGRRGARSVQANRERILGPGSIV
jgi:hypothetical protein